MYYSSNYNQGHKFWGFIDQSYLKITQNLGSLLMKLSQSNFNLWLPDCYLVHSYLIATVKYLIRVGKGKLIL